MSRYEVLHSRIGELLEMIDCHAIANGAEPKGAKLTFEEILKLR